jgi:uncharacterized Zn finger protein (UPF0148 family)
LTVRTFQCWQCGGGVPLDALTASVHCPFCRATLRLAPDEARELASYRTQVRDRLTRAQQELGHAAGWDRWYGGDEARKRNRPWIAVALWLGLVVSMGSVGFAVQYFQLSNEVVAKVMPIALYGVMFVVLGGYFVWYYTGRRRPTLQSRVAPMQTTCPSCGAPNALYPGEVLERCRYCSAQLVAGTQVREQGLAEADRALFRAELERNRAERRGMAALSSMSAGAATPYIVLGSFLPMTGFGAVYAVYAYLIEEDPGTPLAAVGAMGLLAMINVGLIAMVYAFRSFREQRWQTLRAGVLGQLGGAPLADLDAMNLWLDRHWAGAVPLAQLFRGPCFLGAAFEVEGYPVLLVCNPVGASEHYPGFVSVRVGAWLPESQLGSARASLSGARSALEAQGFGVEIDRAGLTALCDAKRARRLAKADPSALSGVIVTLARVARDVGGRPVRES